MFADKKVLPTGFSTHGAGLYGTKKIALLTSFPLFQYFTFAALPIPTLPALMPVIVEAPPKCDRNRALSVNITSR